MHCDTLVKTELDGGKVYKPKIAYNTQAEAIQVAKHMNSKPKQIIKLVAYKCKSCHKYHIGRNGKVITPRDRTKFEAAIVRKQDLKVVGKIKLP